MAFTSSESSRSRYNHRMSLRGRAFTYLGLWSILSFVYAGCTYAEDLPAAPQTRREQPAAHRFWDRENILLFSGVAVFRGLDYASTRNFMARGRQEVLIPDDVVNNSAGFAALEAAATMTSVGLSYLMHRTRHHKLERWISIGHISVTGFGVVRNYSLESAHHTP